MMKVWNMVLILSTFLLCIFGTFLTRSGIVSSVHSFAQSPIGPYFSSFLFLMISLSAYLLLTRLDALKSENRLDSVVSRESSFLFNNLILLASMFAILWGTIFPIITEYLQNEKRTVSAPFYNKVNIPIGLFLLFLTGVGPLLAWRKTSTQSLKRNFTMPTLAALITGAVFFAFGMRHFYSMVCLILCVFVMATIMAEFHRGANARRRQGESYFEALWILTFRNTRRYGGYIVHMAMVFLFVGFAGAGFNQDIQKEMGPGENLEIGSYSLTLEQVKNNDNPNYPSAVAVMKVYQKRQTHRYAAARTALLQGAGRTHDGGSVALGPERGPLRRPVRVHSFNLKGSDARFPQSAGVLDLDRWLGVHARNGGLPDS